jgi:mRNA interferase MazF
MVKNSYVPQTGDVVWINLNPAKGHEQANLRPALILSPKKYNQKTSLAIMCPITSQVKGYPFEVLVETKEVKGVVLVDQIRSLDWKAREVKYVAKAKPGLINLVREKLSVLIL